MNDNTYGYDEIFWESPMVIMTFFYPAKQEKPLSPVDTFLPMHKPGVSIMDEAGIFACKKCEVVFTPQKVAELKTSS
jgi:hypothetical protein